MEGEAFAAWATEVRLERDRLVAREDEEAIHTKGNDAAERLRAMAPVERARHFGGSPVCSYIHIYINTYIAILNPLQQCSNSETV